MNSPAPLTYPRWVALALAHALQADDAAPAARAAPALLARARQCLGDEALPWLKPLCRALAAWPAPVWAALTVPELAGRLQALPTFRAGFDAERHPRPRVRQLLLRPAHSVARPFALEHLDLPPWHTPADLAQGLGLSPDMLDLLAGPAQRYREATPTARRPWVQATGHYRCLMHPKRSGGLRLIEAPLPALKAVQRRLLAALLNRVPVHEAAHGFVPGRNVASHAALHAGQAWVFRFDLQDFFPSIGRARIGALFRTLGLVEAVGGALATLCTTRTPATVRARLAQAGALDFMAAKRLAAPHLPQGAPTSPALANLCAFGLDLRLDGLARRFGARYSRYADDLVFSGPATLGRDAPELCAWVAAIVEDEGFRLRRDKTRQMPWGGRQQVTGVVVNERPNLARDDYDRLRATLHRAGHGHPVDAALRAQLQGRVAWARQFVTPERADKLQRLLARIPLAG